MKIEKKFTIKGLKNLLVNYVLCIYLLFKGEKKQFFFNGAYAVVFFGCVAAGTAMGGLYGFVLSILLANGLRFLAAVLWGLLGKQQAKQA